MTSNRMNSSRKIALVTGVLFVITYVTSIPPVLFLYVPLLGDPRYIVGAGADNGVLWGAFLELLLIVANIGTAVVLFPLLKRVNEIFALGYVTARVVESVFIAVGILSVLTIVTLRQDLGGAQGADAAGLAFTAVEQAKAAGDDLLLIDTAGRLHNKAELMAELQKVARVIKKVEPTAPHHVVLVLDATTGQNAIQQARAFIQVVPVDGVLLSKLDGTAKGGMAVAVARDLRLPVLYLGVGETPDDLVPFRPRDFASALLG